MFPMIPTMKPLTLHDMMSRGDAVRMLDVRTPAEFNDGHVAGSLLLPLGEIDAERVTARLGSGAGTRHPLYLICGSGQRAEQAARKLGAQGLKHLILVEGGTQAWKASRLPMRKTPRLPSLERQTQISLGIAILLMLIKGALLHPLFFALVGLLAVGLIVAGVTARCGLSALLARMPWNRARVGEAGLPT